MKCPVCGKGTLKKGNSLAVKIPKEIANFLKLTVGKETYIRPDNGRLIVEFS